MMNDFGFHDLHIELSTQPEDSMGEQANWDKATQALKDAMESKGITYSIDEGGGAFYGPKIDIKLKDAIGRLWQCGTIQCDFNLPERFELTYIDDKGQQQRPIMLHRALLGSLERFIGTLIEHYAGNFPLWLAPNQVLIIPIKQEHEAFAAQVKQKLTDAGFRVTIDNRNESLSKRIREGSVMKIPYHLIIGDKEVANQQVSVRIHTGGDLGSLEVDALIARLAQQIIDKK